MVSITLYPKPPKLVWFLMSKHLLVAAGDQLKNSDCWSCRPCQPLLTVSDLYFVPVMNSLHGFISLPMFLYFIRPIPTFMTPTHRLLLWLLSFFYNCLFLKHFIDSASFKFFENTGEHGVINLREEYEMVIINVAISLQIWLVSLTPF